MRKKRLQQINEQYKKHCYPGEEIQRQEYKDHLNKYKVLMALTENSVNEICGSGGGKTQETLNLWDTKEQKKRKIGFMFFNSDVILQKNVEKSAKIIKVSDRQHFDQIETSSDQIRVDFENFDNLYRIGKENSLGYGANISSFKFKDIEVRGMDNPQGQTALGPALTIASGIVNNYGPGSSIVVVTDGKANKGIFSSDGVYKKDLQQLKYRLEKAKAELCLIRLGKSEEDKNEIKSDLQKFFSKQTKIVVVPLDLKQSLGLLKSKIKALVDNSVGGKTFADDIKIKSQNANVNYEFSLKDLKKKLFSSKQNAFFSAKISEPKLTHRDYRYPFMTQVVVKYTDIESRRSSHFMCYMIQKLIKYSEIKKQEQQLLESTQTLNNVLNYISNEGQKIDIDKLPIEMQLFRTSIMHSMSMSIDKSRRMEQMQFEEQFFPKTFEEENKRNFTLKEKLQTQIIKNVGGDDDKL